MAIVFDGRKLAARKEKVLQKKVQKLVIRLGFKPKLVAMMIGQDPTSQIYLGLKGKAAGRIGIDFEKKEFPENVDSQEVINEIKRANQDEQVWGIMVQLPLPESIINHSREAGSRSAGQSSIINSIVPQKDVDCLTKENLALLKQGKPRFLPATVRGIIEILKAGQIKLAGKKIVVVGAKGFVGQSLTGYLQALGDDVVGLDQETDDLGKLTKTADILISATGVPNLIKKEMVKSGAVVIDVGSPYGDVDFEKVKKVASFLTPVPGGVGPMTVVSLFENLLEVKRHF